MVLSRKGIPDRKAQELKANYIRGTIRLAEVDRRSMDGAYGVKSKKKRVKSFPSLTAHWAALISVPLALSQTPAYTAKTADTGQCIARCVRLLPSG